MIRDSKSFFIGLVMMIVFIGVYLYMMSPNFGNGRNGLEFSDDMFNSLSKGSVQSVVQGEIKKAAKWNGTNIDVTLKCKDASQAKRWGDALQKVDGAVVNVNQDKVALKADLGKFFATIGEDCTNMFNNNGDAVKQKYNTDPRDATNRWYSISKAVGSALEKKEQFKESVAIQTFMTKVIEPGYNYYGVETKFVKDNKGTMSLMLLFYLFYTLWYGFAIYYICVGLGIVMTKGKKAEA
ncbi:hypothetical protein Desca_0907 [Desulfotomaculum nigrificans CO-1-SRB]|uniref:Uncharacterized protein n=1 Tax=Desulfotomaculum nigrificans (strain DSM 14880 / VKM B-2319 / CO-1-SRB) TaxID=868595 RepID=F6B9T8_DESCC|nr:hypothetical protein [Desulfotomaculum nigrificans]AEF93786.1 hypothetical protein Desca_0907 [Desulfotomaculum nigrificans CO-1-SRB]